MSASPFVIRVEPRVGPLWDLREIHVSGAVSGSLVTIRSHTIRNGVPWEAQATFLADEHGTIDLGADAPVSGDYRVADAMGLFWSQLRSVDTAVPPEPSDAHTPIVTKLTAYAEPGTGTLHENKAASGETADVVVEQWLQSDDVVRREIREQGLVGTLFTPGGEGPHPTVIVLNGSGGGINEARAALYASRGIQALALGYFRAEELSQYISRTPLEYFETALRFVNTTLNPRGGRAVVSGQSRGGELSLLLASLYPDLIAGVAAFVPGAFRFGAQGAADPNDGWNGATWTLGGEPLEHLWNANEHVTWQPWTGGPPPNRHADVYVTGMRARELARRSRIEIERFPGPVACISGLDDRAWPSSWASRLVMRTLEAHGHRAERLHLDYLDAGHAITLPHLPATEISKYHPVLKAEYSNGGTPRGNAYANTDSFHEVCAFIVRTTQH